VCLSATRGEVRTPVATATAERFVTGLCCEL
jgi:hypothetical protein